MGEGAPQSGRLILFCKYPTPGEVKTRLIPAIGAEGAADLQRSLILRTLAELRTAAEPSKTPIEIRYAGATAAQFTAFLGDGLRFAAQGAGDLGERMSHAFRSAFDAGVSKAVLVGADIPEEGWERIRGRIAI